MIKFVLRIFLVVVWRIEIEKEGKWCVINVYSYRSRLKILFCYKFLVKELIFISFFLEFLYYC